MPIDGRREDDDAKKKALEKRQANGFGQPGVAGRPKFDSSELWERKAEDEMPELIDQAFAAIKRGVTSPNAKLASETALKLMKMTWPQDQKIVVEGNTAGDTHNYLLLQQDNLSAKEQALLSRLQDVLKEGAEVEARPQMIEGEAIEVEKDTE